MEQQEREKRIINGEIDGIEELKSLQRVSELQPRKNVKIVAIDLQPMATLEGITTLVGDITHPSTIPRILEALDPNVGDSDETGNGAGNPVDLVISDGAPDVTGLHDLDIYIQSQLLFSALDLGLRVLKPGGTFVAKIFRGKDVDLIYAQMRCFFKTVTCAKPRSSRASSLEAFIVCQKFSMPKGYSLDKSINVATSVPRPPKEPATGEPFIDGQRRTEREDGTVVLEFESDEENDTRWIAPFVACGDLSAWDADATYHLPKDHISLDPVQPPTAPPYKKALELRRKQGGFYGKTKGLDLEDVGKPSQ